jgi:hypothetical protein
MLNNTYNVPGSNVALSSWKIYSKLKQISVFTCVSTCRSEVDRFIFTDITSFSDFDAFT